MEYTLDDLMKCIKKNNRNPIPDPMPPQELQRLRVRKYRGPHNEETTELPASLKALLGYDRNLTNAHDQKIFALLLKRIDEYGVLHSVTPDKDAYYGNCFDECGKSLEELLPLWNDDPCLPALIPVLHPGDQRIFIYLSERDDIGEYPIARMERFEFWLHESSLIEYLYNIFNNDEESKPEWQARRTANEKRDKALVEMEFFDDTLFAKIEDFGD